MIVVTGASGVLGRLVVERLIELVPAGRVVASVRDPAAVADLADRGVEVRRGDFAEPESLPGAFAGAEQVLVVSGGVLGGPGVALHRAAIEAAAAAGAARVLYTSHQGARADSPFAAAPQHAATEDVLAASGVPWTSLRNGFYASTVPMLLGDAASTGELRLPADGAVAWTTREDLAAGTARLLADGPGDTSSGPTAPLTGPAAVDMAEVAAVLGELTGRPVRRVVVDDDEYRATLLARGTPAFAADMLVGMFAASRRGDFAPADPTLPGLLDRAPQSIRDVLAGVLRPAR